MTFPISPANNASATVNNIEYVYNSSINTWTRVPTTVTGGGGFSNFVILSTDTVLNSSQTNILANTYVSSINITLPTSVTTGFTVIFGDGGGDKDVSPAYIKATGSTINGANSTLLFNSTGSVFYMVYDAVNTNWRVLLNA